MRIARTVWYIPAALVLLAACVDEPVSPVRDRDVVSRYFSCGGGALDARVLSTTPDRESTWGTGTLPLVTVRATYGGGTLPFNVIQMMTFRPGTDVSSLPCLGTDDASYTVMAAEPEDTVAPPPEVDPSWWTTLSPRERRVLIRFAQAYMTLNPDGYKTVGRVIAERFEPVIPEVKVRSKVRALDYYGATSKAELLSAGIYACALYQRFQADPYSKILGSELIDFASSLTAAFGESQFASRPLTAVLFGKNGAYGAGLAAANPHGDCGTMVFQSVGSTIDVTDPYTTTPAPEELDR